jgi:hypothetical protein
MKYVQRDYVGKNVNFDQLQTLIANFFREEGFRVQCGKHPRGLLVQAKKGGIFRTILAENRSYTITIDGSHASFKIRMGIADWLTNLEPKALDPIFETPMISFTETPEALWTYELEHHFWHYVETQIDLGIQ